MGRQPRQGGRFGRLVIEPQEDEHVPLVVNPSYMCANNAHTCIYMVSELKNEEASVVTAFGFTPATAQLEFLNSVKTFGAEACHVAITDDERFITVANYGGENVVLLPINDDGSLGEHVAGVTHEPAAPGPGQNAERQERSHPHMGFLHSGKDVHRMLVPDLGLDKVVIYSLDVSLQPPSFEYASHLALPPGSGPRHLALHPSGRWIYVLNELLSTIVACAWDVQQGVLEILAPPLPTVPGEKVGVDGQTFCAAVRVSPDGRFVYASNRGHDSLSIFAVEDDGTLNPAGVHSTRPGGQPAHQASWPATWPPRLCPRDFALCAEGQWVVMGNQDHDSIVVASRDRETGALADTGVTAPCVAPACILPLF